MKAESLDNALRKYKEFQGVRNTLKSMDCGQILVKVEYLDKDKGSCTYERENHFRPHSDEFKEFLKNYSEKLSEELESLGLDLPEEITQEHF